MKQLKSGGRFWPSTKFNRIWHYLAGLGLVDALGGREYHRILAAYDQAGQPKGLVRFIRLLANQPPNEA